MQQFSSTIKVIKIYLIKNNIKEVGDSLAVDDVIAEVETDKVNVNNFNNY